jgi:hypothetical protein
MPRTLLDRSLLRKIAKKTGKTRKYVREQVSKRASRRGISSEAALIIWAKKLSIGTACYQRTLAPHIQEQVRDELPTIFATVPKPKGHAKVPVARQKDSLFAAIEYLLKDPEILNRCTDLLRARGKFDRVFREATTVLDDRLRKLAAIADRKISSADLAAKILHPKNAILRVSPRDDEQLGFFYVCQGLFLAFRNPTHHQLSDSFTRENALQFCAFVDSLLAALEKAQRQI